MRTFDLRHRETAPSQQAIDAALEAVADSRLAVEHQITIQHLALAARASAAARNIEAWDRVARGDVDGDEE